MSAEKPRGRLLALDALRGLAVVLMIEQHLGVWLCRDLRADESPLDHPVYFALQGAGGGAAPAFLVLAGIGASLLSVRDGARSRPTLVRRGLGLIGLGLALNLATPSWFTWRSWYILHTLGMGLVVAAAAQRWSARGLLTATVVLWGATAPLQAWLGVPLDPSSAQLSGRLAGGDPAGFVAEVFRLARLAFTDSWFPLVPWLALCLLGGVAGRWIAEGRLRPVLRLALAALFAGLAGPALRLALGGGAPGSVLDRFSRLDAPFFPASASMAALLGGCVLLAVVAALRLEERVPLRADAPLVTLGRASLTLLLVHVPLFREGARATGLWYRLDFGPGLAVVAGTLLLAAVATRAWSRRGFRFGAEDWLRRLG